MKPGRSWGMGPDRLVKIATIRRPAEKLLVVDEDNLTIDDGDFNPGLVGTSIENALAVRHDRGRQADDARGNVAFADGYVAYVDRTYTRDKRHYDPLEP